MSDITIPADVAKEYLAMIGHRRGRFMPQTRALIDAIRAQLPAVKPEPEGDDWVMVTFYNDGHYASARTALEIGDDWAKFIEDYPDAEVYRPESKHRPKSAPSNGIFDAVCCGRGFNSAARLSDHLNGGPDD
jgi:hypothetical protein